MHKLKVLFIGIKNEKTSQQAIKFLKKQNISLKIIHSKGIRNEIIQKEFLNWKGDLILHFRSYIKLPNKILQNCYPKQSQFFYCYKQLGPHVSCYE